MERKMITIVQCRDFRMVMAELTHGCMLTEDEYREFGIVINKVLNHMGAEENERSKMDQNNN